MLAWAEVVAWVVPEEAAGEKAARYLLFYKRGQQLY
jgi:hypothetical protein